MKKMLSLLASLGLVATSSMAVVACTKQDAIPTFKSVQDIKNIYLTNDDQMIVAENPLDVFKPKKGFGIYKIADDKTKNLVVSTLATKYKNSSEVSKIIAKGYQSNVPDLEPVPYELTAIPDSENAYYEADNKTIVYVDYQVAFAVPGTRMETKEPIAIYSNPFTIRIASSSKYKMTTKDSFSKPFDINSLMPKGQNNFITNAIKGTIMDYKNRPQKMTDGDFINYESTTQTMSSLDFNLLNALAKSLSGTSNNGKTTVTAIAGQDETANIRYASIQQQVQAYYSDDSLDVQIKNGFKDYSAAQKEFNKAIVAEAVKQINATANQEQKPTPDSILSAVFKDPKTFAGKNGFAPFTYGGTN